MVRLRASQGGRDSQASLVQLTTKQPARLELLPCTIMKPALYTFMYFIRNLSSTIITIMHFSAKIFWAHKVLRRNKCHGLKSTRKMSLILSPSWRFTACFSRFKAQKRLQ